MIERFLNPSIKYTTTALGSLPGAKLYFTSAGTSTPKTVYKDGNKSVSHAYPVEADAFGIFEPIFLDGLYKVELKDKDGNTQTGWPIDNVGGNFSFVATDLTFTGTGGKILGDFSNSTPTNRVRMQTTTTNGDSYVDVIPSSGGAASAFEACNSSTANYAALQMYAGSSESSLSSIKVGSGSYLPFSLYVGGAQSMTVPTATGIPQFTQSIKLGNTAVTDPLVMDWYEEGTFTPTIVGTSTAGTGTYTIQLGKYNRSGNRIDYSIHIGWSAHTGTGNISISGLPFTSSSMYSSASISYSTLTVGAGKELSIIVNSGATTLGVSASDPSGGAAASIAIDTAVSYMIISGTYFV